MSYLVLARKYRPQSFEDLVGQEHVVRTLQNAIKAGRVAHAYLFTGARGVGKTTSARLLAKALNCVDGPTPTPCGECPACREITSGQNVDVQEIDGASNNGVDQVRELRDNARYLPSRDRHKIYIIDEVHMLSGAAFNALLKILEEPPAHVKFIFATTEPHKIPVTILSRTQRFDFRRIPLKKIIARIDVILQKEGITIGPRGQALVARQAEGSMRDALSLLDQVVSTGDTDIADDTVEEVLGAIDRTIVAQIAGALLEADAATALHLVSGVFDRGLDLGRLAEDLAWHLRNLLLVQVGGQAKALVDVPDHEQEVLDQQADGVEPATLTFLFDVIHTAAPQISRAAQPRLGLEVALLKAIHLAPGADVHTLLERVEALAAGKVLPPAGSGGGRPKRPASSVSRPTPEKKAVRGRAGRADGFDEIAAKMAQRAAPAPEEPPPPSDGDAPPPERDPTATQARSRSRPKKTAPPKTATPRGASPGAPQDRADQASEIPRLAQGDDPSSSLEQRFEKLIDVVLEGNKPFLAAALEHARPIEISEETLTLALPRGLYYDGLSGVANQRALDSLVSDHIGRPLRVRLELIDNVDLEGVPEAIATRKERRLAEQVELLREEALNNPSVRLALEALDGEIEEIRILGD